MADLRALLSAMAAAGVRPSGHDYAAVLGVCKLSNARKARARSLQPKQPACNTTQPACNTKQPACNTTGACSSRLHRARPSVRLGVRAGQAVAVHQAWRVRDVLRVCVVACRTSTP